MTTSYPHTDSPTCIDEACTTRRHTVQNGMNLSASLPAPANATPEAIRRNIIAHAAKAHEDLPQYDGAWEDWTLVEVTGTVRTKLGLAFEKGDITIGRYEQGLGMAYPGRWTLYSIRNGINTAGGLAREIATFELRRNQMGTGLSNVVSTHTNHRGADRALADAPKDRDHWYTIQPILEVRGA